MTDLAQLAVAVEAEQDADDRLAEGAATVWSDLPALGAFLDIPCGEGVAAFNWSIWHPDQKRFEQERTGYDVVLKSRQVGFSTVELARDVQFARTHEGSRVQIVVDDRDEKAAFFGRLKTMVDSLVSWGLVPPTAKYDTKTEIVWGDTRSAIYITEAGASEGAAQKTGRSGTVHRLHATEAAFWGSPEETWASLKGATRLGSEVVVETTANGADTWFHDVWLRSREGRFGRFAAHFYPWWQRGDFVLDPRIAPDPPRAQREKLWEARLVEDIGVGPQQLAWWRALVQETGLDKALREFPPTEEAAFQSAGATWIEPEYLDALSRHVRDPQRVAKMKRGEMRVYVEPKHGVAYVIGADVAEGTGRDESAFCVMEHRTGRVVATYDDAHVKPKEFGRVLVEASDIYHSAMLAPEREGRRDRGTDDGSSREPCGLVVISAIEDAGKGRRLYRDKDSGKPGWATRRETRGEMLYALLDMIERASDPKATPAEVALGTSPDRRTVAEARGMVEKKGKIRARGKHSSGGDDGLFFAWAIAHQVKARSRIPGRGAIHTGEVRGMHDFRT